MEPSLAHSLQLLELEIGRGRHIAWDDTMDINNRAEGFDSIMLRSTVMYYDIILIYGTLSFAFY